MKKVVTIVGARPQFIKTAAISRVIRKDYKEVLIHTGQHYDKNMSEDFFHELEIPFPDYNLNVGSGRQAEQTAQMMKKIEDILIDENPDAVLVYGDTNSTLAGALTAVKMHIPVIHIEAGLRSFDKRMPEEINRILTDHVSSLLFCPTDIAVNNLQAEGITKGVYKVGDVMCDTVKHYTKKIRYKKEDLFKRLKPLYVKYVEIPENWYLATIHRAENTDIVDKLQIILDALENADEKVIFSVHPRIRGYIDHLYKENMYNNIYFVEPVGYKDMLFLTNGAVKVITDSGGLQKESYIMETPCITVRGQTEWVETLEGNYNILAEINKEDIIRKMKIKPERDKYKSYYGDGNASKQICNIIGQHI